MPRARVYPPGQDPGPSTGTGVLALIQPNPLISLYEIDLPTSPPTKFRATAYPAIPSDAPTYNPSFPGIAVYFERDSDGAAIPYYSFSIWHEDSSADSEGGLRKVELKIQNVTRELSALLEAYDGLTGQKVRHVIVRLAELPDAVPRWEETFEIKNVSVTEELGTLSCGQTSLERLKWPGRRISRTHCQHRYGGPGCGYDTTRTGSLQTCDFTNDGPNGCLAHGLDEAAAGLPNRHSAARTRILLFPGAARSSELEAV